MARVAGSQAPHHRRRSQEGGVMKGPAWMGAVLLATLSMACASTRSSDVRANVDLAARERTSDKLVARGMAFESIGDLTRAEQYLSAALDRGADPEQVTPALL